jgi:enamine deaminase RidA (YjgF/YER057c/UK114 family)
MSASISGARSRTAIVKRLCRNALPVRTAATPLVVAGNGARPAAAPAEFSCVDLGDSARLALMLTPKGRGPFRSQAQELLLALENILAKQPQRMTVTFQTVFLRDAADQETCVRMLAEFFGKQAPVTNFVLQPPCCGAALALEAWAIGGPSVRIEHFGPHALGVSYDRIRWVYCAGIGSTGATGGAYQQSLAALERLRVELSRAGAEFDQVVRTWLYLGGITEPEAGTQRYKEMNRARSDFYRGVRFGCLLAQPNIPHGIYPASTGIGMAGAGLVAGCMTIQTNRKDVFLLPLENPQQTPAYAYHPRHSPLSPKFSRSVALVVGDYVTTWISGTASIVGSESRHPGDIEKQTEQTIDNIERLIAPENFTFHGVAGAGATLHDLAKIRIYLKRRQDFAKARAICERRFGHLPAIYAVADICRPELLVEIEGVAFSRYVPATKNAHKNGESQLRGT